MNTIISRPNPDWRSSARAMLGECAPPGAELVSLTVRVNGEERVITMDDIARYRQEDGVVAFLRTPLGRKLSDHDAVWWLGGEVDVVQVRRLRSLDPRLCGQPPS